jgi:hypothetical protein
MTGREFQGFLNARPFTPLRVYASDGRTYDLKHPEQAYVMSTCVAIPMTDTDQVPDRIEDRIRLEFLSTMHIVRVEQLQSPTPQNGSAAKSTG